MAKFGEVILKYEFLECPVCLELFDDTCRMLPCQHTFHKECLLKIYSLEKRLECPQCRKEVTDDIEELKPNYFLLSVLDKVKPKPSESDEESEQLQFVIEKSKTEAEVRAREEFLLSQKEKLECELMLLKSEKKAKELECTASQLQHQLSVASSYCGFTAEDVAKENDCCTPSSGAAPRWPEEESAAASLLVQEFGSFRVCDKSSPTGSSGQSDSSRTTGGCCSTISLADRVSDGFEALGIYESHPSLVVQLQEVVRAVDGEQELQRVELINLIDYGELVATYLNILADLSRENSFSASSHSSSEGRTGGAIPRPNTASASCAATASASCAAIASASCAATASASCVSTASASCASTAAPNASSSSSYESKRYLVGPAQPFAVATGPAASSRVDLVDEPSGDATGTGSSSAGGDAAPEINSCLGNDYQSYSFEDDDRNLNYAIELSRQLMVTNESDDMMEEVLRKSKMSCVIDEQKQIFLDIREKVEIQTALLLSKS